MKIAPILKSYKSKNGFQLVMLIRYKFGRREVRGEVEFLDELGNKLHCQKRHYLSNGIVIGGSRARYKNLIIENQINKVDAFIKQAKELNIPDRQLARNLKGLLYDDNVTMWSVKNQGNAAKFMISGEQYSKIQSGNLLVLFDDYKNDAPKSYHTLKKVLQEYITFNKFRGIHVSEFKIELINHFARYLSKKSDLNYTISTVKKHIKHIKHYGRWLRKKGYIEDRSFEDFELVVGEKNTSHFQYRENVYSNIPSETLKINEFKKLVNTDYQSRIDNQVRDMFYLQVMLGGLRSIDFFQLSQNDFIKENDNLRFKIHSQKSGYRVNNKLSKRSKSILKEWNYVLPEISKMDYNKYLKSLAAKSNLTREVIIYKEVANSKKPVLQKKIISDTISSKTARKTAVSCLISLGYSQDETGKFTGHSSKSIQRYISVFDELLDIMSERFEGEIDDL